MYLHRSFICTDLLSYNIQDLNKRSKIKQLNTILLLFIVCWIHKLWILGRIGGSFSIPQFQAVDQAKGGAPSTHPVYCLFRFMLQ